MDRWTLTEARGAVLMAAILSALAWAGAAPPADAPPAPVPASSGPAADVSGTLDLNRAGARDLDDLPGIGPVLAERIVTHRRRQGPFESVDELAAVRGIGPRLIERLRSRIRVSQPPDSLLR